jgi:hypothetical protein
MSKLLCDDARRLAPARNAIQFIARGNVPGTTRIALVQFSASSRALELVEGKSVCYRGTAQGNKVPPSIPIHATPHSGDISMTLTTAHIPAIVALIAGILILVMPRLLNLVVAIYLICTGLIGLGLLKWLHM